MLVQGKWGENCETTPPHGIYYVHAQKMQYGVSATPSHLIFATLEGGQGGALMVFYN